MPLTARDLEVGYQMEGPVFVRLSDLQDLFAPNTIAALEARGLEIHPCESDGEQGPFGAVEVHQLIDLVNATLRALQPDLFALRGGGGRN